MYILNFIYYVYLPHMHQVTKCLCIPTNHCVETYSNKITNAFNHYIAILYCIFRFIVS